MAGRPHTAVPNIFASEGAGIPNNITLLDADFADVLSFYNDSAIGWVNYGTDTGAANAYVLTLAAAPSAYLAGMTLVVKIANTNTGASTINVNALGSQAIVNPAGIALTGGELPVNSVVKLVHDGTSFRIVGPCALSKQYFSQVGNPPGLECAGYTSVNVTLSWVTTTSSGIVLSHLAAGVPVCVTFINSSSTANAYSINANDPGGTAFVEVVASFSSDPTGGTIFNLQTGGTSLSASKRITYFGISQTDRLEMGS